ncbi:magnesium transporter [Novosphingobium sp. 1949]|uniref:Magnesium transporter n=1 Tax=Novosphingobium organovorum TaxID=2930092 RepID=A0ABT0BFW6_9SPHN|nr:CorA family divalent cation transporter [Novosphingobium organovorum]MCJ2183878.1 magnesium transporter [Novosphingobium organovorum]
MSDTRFEVHVEQGTWIALCDPDEALRQDLGGQLGVDVPTLRALREIESTSRLRCVGDALVMTAPLLTGGSEAGLEADPVDLVPTGFVLLPATLLTVHYAPYPAFAHMRAEIEAGGDSGPAAVLAHLLEDVVDRAADQLETVAEAAAQVSHTIFYTDLKRRGLKLETRLLERTIIRLGRASERVSRVRSMFLSIGRMAKYVIDHCEKGGENGRETWLDPRTRARFKAIAQDIASLDEFEVSLSARIQFLLDAATSLISIRQNDVTKVLTVASVVGIPPVMVVGVYGMNFHAMPELSWPWGYPFALALCAVSTVVPYVWFKLRKWV